MITLLPLPNSLPTGAQPQTCLCKNKPESLTQETRVSWKVFCCSPEQLLRGLVYLIQRFPTKQLYLIWEDGFAPAQKNFSSKANPRQAYTNPLLWASFFLHPAYLHHDSLERVRNTLVSEPRHSWTGP